MFPQQDMGAGSEPCVAARRGSPCPSRVNRVAPTGSKASPNVRYAFNSDRICAPQRTDAMVPLADLWLFVTPTKRRAVFVPNLTYA
jgi:hypothetical protein